MAVERIVFLVTAVMTLGYVLLKRRKIDWFSLSAASAGVYFSPGFFGFVTDPDLRRFHEIEGAAYLTFALVFAAIGLGAVHEDFAGRARQRRVATGAPPEADERNVARVFAVLSAVSLAFAVVQMGDLLWTSEKEVAMTTHGRWLIAYEFTACFAFLTYLASGARTGTIVTALLILPTLLFGYRTGIVMSLVAGFMIQMRKAGPVVLLSKWRPILWVAAALYGAMFFKTIQFGLKLGVDTGQWSVLANTLESENVYSDAVFNAEPFLVQNTLNEVVKTKFSVGIEQLDSLFAVFVPLGNELGLPSKGFNDYFQPALFSDVDYGLASNIWAQAYSLGALSVVALFCVAFIGVIRALNVAYMRASGVGLAAVALAGAYWCFYIHRNDLLYEALLLRRVFIVLVVGKIAAHVLARHRARARLLQIASPESGV